MISLEDLQFIDALSRAGSLSAAARSLNVTPPALSMRLKKLERVLDIGLVVRSSRHLRFTSEGERLVAEAQSLIERINALPGALAGEGRDLTGRLHIVSSFGFGRIYIAPLIARFSKLHPSVRVTLDLSEKPWAENKNADVVIHIGVVRDSSWVGHLLARNARWVCAGPDYLRRHGVPIHPKDLLHHQCLCVRENEEDVTLWHYGKSVGKRPARSRSDAIRVTPTLTSNDGEVVRNWARAGLGVMLRSQWDASPFVKSGELRRILTEWDFEGADVLALVPARHEISARVARFIDFLKDELHPAALGLGQRAKKSTKASGK